MLLEQLRELTGQRLGVHDVACPQCGVGRRAPANRTRRVLRIWMLGPDFASWHCARCGDSGYAHHRGQRPNIEPRELQRVQEEAAARELEAANERLNKARGLWRRRRPIQSTVAETYLRDVRACRGELPRTLGYLDPRGEHPPAMIAAFGFPEEPEPGRVAIHDQDVRGVHVTRLKADGSGKADEEPQRVIVGRCLGSPIVLAPLNDLLGLAVTEGIEDGLSTVEATGLGCWVAGAASRMPHLAQSVPPYTDRVSVIADPDQAGQRGADELRRGLQQRRISVSVIQLGRWT